MDTPAPGPPSAGTRRRKDSALEAVALVGDDKVQEVGRIVAFVDESGLSERLHWKRIGAPKGQTPVLQYQFNWNACSAVAGVTFWNFYFRLFAGAVGRPEVTEFLKHLLRHLGGEVLIVWEGLPAHCSQSLRGFVRQQRRRTWVEFLLPYAPELNPTEYVWGYLKQHEPANFYRKDVGRFSMHAIRALKPMRRTDLSWPSGSKQASLTIL